MWRTSGRKYQMKRDRRKETENKMKKVYEKPQVYMERFELSQNVAVCDYQFNGKDINTCKITEDRYEADGVDLAGGFMSENTCKFAASLYCYFDGDGSFGTIFTS